MKFGVTMLLVACSLSLRGENTNEVSEAGRGAGFLPKTTLNLEGKLEWNAAPGDGEVSLGTNHSRPTVGVPAVTLTPPGTVPADSILTHSAGDSVSLVDEARIERVLRKIEPLDGVRLGESDYVFRSPILEGLVPRRLPDGASRGEKLLNLPVVRFLKPLPMASPPDGGKYFKWGSRDEAWAEYSRPVSGPGRADNGM